MKIKIPQYAKRQARQALEKRRRLLKKEKFGLSPSEAREKGIRSGVRQAKKLLNNTYLSYKQAIPYARFYQRFKNCKTKKCEGAIQLWGGRKFGRFVTKYENLYRVLKFDKSRKKGKFKY